MLTVDSFVNITTEQFPITHRVDSRGSSNIDGEESGIP